MFDVAAVIAAEVSLFVITSDVSPSVVLFLPVVFELSSLHIALM